MPAPGYSIKSKPTPPVEIKELRIYAAQELDQKFNLREFHDHVLGGGAIPLDVLDHRIITWVAGKKARN